MLISIIETSCQYIATLREIGMVLEAKMFSGTVLYILINARGLNIYLR